MTIFSKSFGGNGPFGYPPWLRLCFDPLGNFLRTPLVVAHGEVENHWSKSYDAKNRLKCHKPADPLTTVLEVNA